MLKIRQLKIHGDGRWPKSRAAMKSELRGLSRSLGLDLKFVTRKKETYSWTQVSTGKARVCEGLNGKLWKMSEVMFYALHEISHWIQYNEGMFKGYFGAPYYDKWELPSPQDRMRLALRAERHADFLAKKLGMELFGVLFVGGSAYDDAETAKPFLQEHYGE